MSKSQNLLIRKILPGKFEQSGSIHVRTLLTQKNWLKYAVARPKSSLEKFVLQCDLKQFKNKKNH